MSELGRADGLRGRAERLGLEPARQAEAELQDSGQCLPHTVPHGRHEERAGQTGEAGCSPRRLCKLRCAHRFCAGCWGPTIRTQGAHSVLGRGHFLSTTDSVVKRATRIVTCVLIFRTARLVYFCIPDLFKGTLEIFFLLVITRGYIH